MVGGLGVSGDSSCADHTIAYRMRHNVGLDAIPTGIMASDNIQYAPVGTAPTASSSRTAASASSTPRRS